MPGNVLDAGDIAVNKMDKILLPLKLFSSSGR